MPSLTDHLASRPVKLLLLGESKSGKTGALASLAEAGYNLRILDFDNGLDVLASVLSPTAMAHVHYITCTEKFRTIGGRVILDGAPRAFQKAMNALDKWKEDDVDFGSVTTWTQKDILVVDSLTFCAKAAMYQILALVNRLGSKPHQSDWGEAQGLVEDMLALLYSDAVKCHVIVNTHVAYQGGDEDVDVGEIKTEKRGLPMAIGRALSPKIPRYFNNALLVKTTGEGSHARRRIYTVPQGVIELGSSAPGKAKADYPLATGLADFFKDIR